ncbi:MAG: hypothetical protein MJY56_01555 [Bacteroidales bacterium]|nr:hypothetical protein [Bacteroidales bacterium]
MLKRFFEICALACLIVVPTSGCGSVKPAVDDAHQSYDIVGIDHFGRSFGTIDGYKSDRTVGLFFWPWIGQPYATGIYDATKIAALPDGLNILTNLEYDCPEISPNGQAHFWGEPLWGYYNSNDEWVVRKQLMMLTLAGVDFIYWDHTNAVIYTDVVLQVCKVIKDMIDAGWNPPRMVSYTHSRSTDTATRLYNEVYSHKEYSDTWYYLDGKPLIIAYTNPEDDKAEALSRGDVNYEPGQLSQEILDFFTFFKPNWPFDPTYEDGFTWIEWYFPQPYHKKSQMVNVTVASHPAVPMSFSMTRPGWINWGRGWNPDTKENVSEDVDRGTFFQREWDEAIKMDPPIISVGGWNEWIAYKQPFAGEYMLCDAASKEFSRDIEPMNGGYEDAFYLQLISNLRRYKGISSSKPRANAPRTIDIEGNPAQWDKVGYVQIHPDAVQMARNAYGASKAVTYTQPAPENALSEVRVSYDSENVYFLVKAKGEWNEPDGSEWLNIYLGTGEPSEKGWNGYEYIIGSSFDDGAVSVEALDADYSKTPVGEARFVREAASLQIALPRDLVGLDGAKGFYFKAAAGVEEPSNIMNTYKTGSAMPMGRLSYQFFFKR